jgi:hypothetical protein
VIVTIDVYTLIEYCKILSSQLSINLITVTVDFSAYPTFWAGGGSSISDVLALPTPIWVH